MKHVRYTKEQREWAIEQMMPPRNRAVVVLAKATGITEVTLRTWQRRARAEGSLCLETVNKVIDGPAPTSSGSCWKPTP